MLRDGMVCFPMFPRQGLSSKRSHLAAGMEIAGVRSHRPASGANLDALGTSIVQPGVTPKLTTMAFAALDSLVGVRQG